MRERTEESGPAGKKEENRQQGILRENFREISRK
jgi:hypothetical protein